VLSGRPPADPGPGGSFGPGGRDTPLKSRIRLLAAAAAAVLGSGLSFAQADPEILLTRLPEPVDGGITIDAGAQTIRNPPFYDARGKSNELAQSLTLGELQLRASYGLSSSVALGLLATYRRNRYCCVAGAALSDSGWSGVGLFADWWPRTVRGRWPELRLGYERAESPHDAVLPVSDGQDRVFLRSDGFLLGRPGGAVGLGLRVDGEYGRAFEIQKSYFQASADLAPQARILRSEEAAVDVVARAGYFIAFDARENGTILRNRRSTRGRAGLELRVSVGRKAATMLFLEAEHGFAHRNSLGGWRLALTLRELFGGR
jgi:hypothetical protein